MTSALDITRFGESAARSLGEFPAGSSDWQTSSAGVAAPDRAPTRCVRFATIDRPGTIVELPYVWDPKDRGWEETDYTGNFLPPASPRRKTPTGSRRNAARGSPAAK